MVIDVPFTCFFLWEELCDAFLSDALAKFLLEMAAIDEIIHF